jgi:hypothetical protein
VAGTCRLGPRFSAFGSRTSLEAAFARGARTVELPRRPFATLCLVAILTRKTLAPLRRPLEATGPRALALLEGPPFRTRPFLKAGTTFLARPVVAPKLTPRPLGIAFARPVVTTKIALGALATAKGIVAPLGEWAVGAIALALYERPGPFLARPVVAPELAPRPLCIALARPVVTAKIALGAIATGKGVVTPLGEGTVGAIALALHEGLRTFGARLAAKALLASESGLSVLARRAIAPSRTTRLGPALAREFLSIVVHVEFAFQGR